MTQSTSSPASLPCTNLLHIHTHTFDVLTWCNMQNNMAVGFLHDGRVFMFRLEVQNHTAVATLVSVGHILQNNPEVLLCSCSFHPWWQGVIAMGMRTNGSMAWACPSCTVLITMGREKPGVLQDISIVQGCTSLAAHHFDSCTFRTGIMQVGS